MAGKTTKPSGIKNLLEQARRSEVIYRGRTIKEIRERCELAIAYRNGKVQSDKVAAALGIKTSQVAAYTDSIIMTGIRQRVLRIEMVEG